MTTTTNYKAGQREVMQFAKANEQHADRWDGAATTEEYKHLYEAAGL